MQIYWLLKSIPELASLASAERRQVWRTDCWHAYRQYLRTCSVPNFVEPPSSLAEFDRIFVQMLCDPRRG